MAGVGTRVSEFFSFSQRLQIYKKEKIFFFFGGGGIVGVDGWTVYQAQNNLPLQLLRRWEHNNALLYKLCP